MQTRPFGKHGDRVSALGFGCMRLPVRDGAVDEPEAVRMIRHAVDRGVNYLDTAWMYHRGESETVVGRALRDGYREKTWVATKMPLGQVESRADLDRIFDRQREKLQVERIDGYLLHGLNRQSWAKALDRGAPAWAEDRKARGHIGYFGFSFHDDADAFVEIVDGYDGWDFCQIQYNYMDVENQAGVRGLRHAAGKGLAVIVMEPLLGGKLARTPPPAVQRVWAECRPSRTPADWALQWLWDQPEVTVVLSGMSTYEQLEQNLKSAEASGVGRLSEAERACVARARAAFRGLSPVPCTGCGYCTPCPQGVDIPRIFEILNTARMYNAPAEGRRRYARLSESSRADQCVECGKCENLCPQGIAVMEWLKRAHAELSPDDPEQAGRNA
ncbi:MAG: aldo/keto reductase [Lentisphaerae bacterium]|nr:aldo/keto reductase [Lentisphaerota bacterium]